MRYRLALDENGRVIGASRTDPCWGVSSAELDVPSAFPGVNLMAWRVVNGVVLFDPLPEEPEEEMPEPVDVGALQAEVAELREAVELLLSGATG